LKTPRLLILKTGITAPTVVESHGDYDVMFKAVLDGPDLHIDVVDAFLGVPLPRPQAYDMAIITGSPHSVAAPEAWVEALADWARHAFAAQMPVLGVCYGHQLLAYAHGGEVKPGTCGLEMGTVDIERTPAGQDDPLLGALRPGERLRFHEVHGDVVTALPEGAVHLAKNPHTEQQAFRLGDRTWGVQFHPEFTHGVMQLYLKARAQRLRDMAEAAGLDPDAEQQKAEASLSLAPDGPALLHRFVELAKQL